MLPHHPETLPAAAILDSRAALRSCAGDRAMLSEVAGLFIKDSARRLAALRQAMHLHDAAQLVFAAHSLRGSAMMFGAAIAVHAAECVEQLAGAGKLTEAILAAMVLDCEILRLVDALDHLALDGVDDADDPSH